uniref:Uncharacterized protein n=1 Tax=Strongyloides stercoralis TaxID=6248 RepID=A0A0K0E5P2_STRER
MNYHFFFIIFLNILSFVCYKTTIAAPTSYQVVAMNNDNLLREKRYFDPKQANDDYWEKKDKENKTTKSSGPEIVKLTTTVNRVDDGWGEI